MAINQVQHPLTCTHFESAHARVSWLHSVCAYFEATTLRAGRVSPSLLAKVLWEGLLTPRYLHCHHPPATPRPSPGPNTGLCSRCKSRQLGSSAHYTSKRQLAHSIHRTHPSSSQTWGFFSTCIHLNTMRSEERRVGKECRSGWLCARYKNNESSLQIQHRDISVC